MPPDHLRFGLGHTDSMGRSGFTGNRRVRLTEKHLACRKSASGHLSWRIGLRFVSPSLPISRSHLSVSLSISNSLSLDPLSALNSLYLFSPSLSFGLEEQKRRRKKKKRKNNKKGREVCFH